MRRRHVHAHLLLRSAPGCCSKRNYFFSLPLSLSLWRLDCDIYKLTWPSLSLSWWVRFPLQNEIFHAERKARRALFYIILYLSLSLSFRRERERKKRAFARRVRKASSLALLCWKEREKRERDKKRKIDPIDARAKHKKSRKNNEKFLFKTQKLTVYPTRRFRRVSS